MRAHRETIPLSALRVGWDKYPVQESRAVTADEYVALRAQAKRGVTTSLLRSLKWLMDTGVGKRQLTEAICELYLPYNEEQMLVDALQPEYFRELYRQLAREEEARTWIKTVSKHTVTGNSANERLNVLPTRFPVPTEMFDQGMDDDDDDDYTELNAPRWSEARVKELYDSLKSGKPSSILTNPTQKSEENGAMSSNPPSSKKRWRSTG